MLSLHLQDNKSIYNILPNFLNNAFFIFLLTYSSYWTSLSPLRPSLFCLYCLGAATCRSLFKYRMVHTTAALYSTGSDLKRAVLSLLISKKQVLFSMEAIATADFTATTDKELSFIRGSRVKVRHWESQKKMLHLKLWEQLLVTFFVINHGISGYNFSLSLSPFVFSFKIPNIWLII